MYTILFLVLTQEEWNDKQREERKSEFAWSYDGTSTTHKNTSIDSRNIEEDDDNEEEDDMVGPSLDMFFPPPTNPNKQTTITSKSFKQPIHNELNDEPAYAKNEPMNYHNYNHDDNDNDDDDDDLDNIPLPSEPKIGAEIAPPPTYEYYGPNDQKRKVQQNLVSVNEMQDSISQGFNNASSKNKSGRIRGIVYDDDDDN